MVDTNLGEATIVYEDPDDGTVETTVENEHLAYFQDHWIVKTEERDGHDVVRRIPAQRVYHVERSVEEFEREVGTLVDEFEREIESIRDAVRSITGEFPAGLLGGGRSREQTETDVTRIDIGDDGLEDGGGGSEEPGESEDESSES